MNFRSNIQQRFRDNSQILRHRQCVNVTFNQMNLLQRTLALVPFLLLGLAGRSQNYFSAGEYGVAVGAAQYFGDLNDNYGLKFMRPAGGFFSRYHLNPYISVRGTFIATQVGYRDALSSNPYNKKRNLEFKSDIFEVSAQAEFNFFRYITGDPDHSWTPYLTGGIGALYYDPYTELGDKRYYLRTLGTEGQNAGFTDRKYSRLAICFPIGFGVKYAIRPGLNIAAEIANRLTTTDYIDDVSKTYVGVEYFPTDPQNPNPAFVLQDRSLDAPALGRAGKQRGNASTRDQYMVFQIHLSFQLKVYRCPDYLNRGYTDL